MPTVVQLWAGKAWTVRGAADAFLDSLPARCSSPAAARPWNVVSPRGVCPDTGLVRLSYRQTRALIDSTGTPPCAGRGPDVDPAWSKPLATGEKL
ncbi:hypothetical protein [Streptomyces sp. QTS52]